MSYPFVPLPPSAPDNPYGLFAEALLSRPTATQPLWKMADVTCVDLFCGGGGASEGIRLALGHGPHTAVNHDQHAIRMHTLNHPATVHMRTDVRDVDPYRAANSQYLHLLWASPDCKHFSKAKGAALLDRGIRSLAWVVSNDGEEPVPVMAGRRRMEDRIQKLDKGWAQTVKPGVIVMENVREFTTWGPLYPDDCRIPHPSGKIDKKTGKPKTMAGFPIKRRAGEFFRRFIKSLEDAGYEVSWRSLCAADYGTPTTRERFVLIARCDGYPITWPARTHSPARTVEGRDGTLRRVGSVEGTRPWIPASDIVDWDTESLSIFASPEEAKAFSNAGHSTRPPRRPLRPNTLGRILAGLKRYVLAEEARPYVVRIGHTGHGNGGKVRSTDEPLSTVVTKNEHLLVTPTLIQTGYGERPGQRPRCLDLEQPLGTVVAAGAKHAIVTAILAQHNLGMVGKQLDEQPLPTVTTVDSKSIVECELRRDGRLGRAHEVAYFVKYYGQEGGQTLNEPLHTIRAGDTFGLVTVTIDGIDWVITDIKMRMLTPRELARAQGFSDDYKLIGTKREQIARIGNSVCPPMARAIVESLFDTEYHKQFAA